MISNQDHIDSADLESIGCQLQRKPRAVHAIAHRCSCGLPDVIATNPKLPDGTPFPTFFYLTCAALTSAVSTLEAEGVMRRMQQRLRADEKLAARYAAAHQDFMDRRRAVADVSEIRGISAGGMPDRVKCLHVLVAHSLAVGPGVNPFGDEALEMLDARGFTRTRPCVVVGDNQ